MFFLYAQVLVIATMLVPSFLKRCQCIAMCLQSEADQTRT